MRKIIGILLIGVLTACNNVGVTETEVQAVQSVLDFYGGICNRHKGFEAKNGETDTYFELEMSQSELVESYSNMLELPASNIAYLFYSNLNDEQDNYTYVKVKINLSNGQSHEYSYSARDLKEIESLTPLLQSITDKIKAQDYEGLISQFDKNIASNLTSEQLKAYCVPYDSAYGRVDNTQFQGYSFFEGETDNRPLAHIAGIMIRENENTPISLFIDRKSKKVVTMKYDF
ncbi:MAG TPA: hypothetical protein VKZ45_05095 [Vicingaceae bacterium]|nr:hypothetical protein [Bacteroidota bacterium]HLU84829.1 hypothetical protein [Vicingaceae bacterium]